MCEYVDFFHLDIRLKNNLVQLKTDIPYFQGPVPTNKEISWCQNKQSLINSIFKGLKSSAMSFYHRNNSELTVPFPH